MERQTFTIEALDRALGGGLVPGTLTVIAGATGVGKSQLGLVWGAAGARAEGRRGIVCDLTSRGDSQNHFAYAERLGDWRLKEFPLAEGLLFDQAWDLERRLGDYLRPVDRPGRRVTKADLSADEWHEWQADMARILRASAGFFYQHFAHGSRRVIFDGLEPTAHFSESVQFNLFEYLYHKVIHLDDEWAAREWLRERYRACIPNVERHRYDHRVIGTLALHTTEEVMLDDLIARPISQGDVFAGANTIIMMGRTKGDGRYGRALAILKHRGSACGDEIMPYRITEQGFVFECGSSGAP